jgi:hypothetical protein
LTAAAALSVVVVGISYLRLASWGNRTEELPLIVVPLTSFEGYKDFASFSPDSSRVAFSWNGGAGESGGTPVRSVYIKRIDSHEPRRLTFSPEDERLPVWSPDGNYIAFSRALTLEPDVIALDEASQSLAKFDDRKSRIVELRFFGGLTTDETAEVLGISSRTVHREWDLASTWLFRELRGQA